MSNVQPDVVGFTEAPAVSIKGGSRTVSGQYEVNLEQSNKASPEEPQRRAEQADENNSRTRMNIRINQAEVNTGEILPPGVKDAFNIVGGKIHNAIIGNTGEVVVDQTFKEFKKGAIDQQYEITGGNFVQTNLGGDATYINADSVVGVTEGGGRRAKTFFTPEELTLHIINRGVTSEQFLRLLEQEYSLTNIAYSLPKETHKTQIMVQALCAVRDEPMEH